MPLRFGTTRMIVAIALTAAACSSAPRQEHLTGWVSDANCGAAHAGGKNPSCVIKCAKGGAHIGHPEWTAQPLVLVEDETNRVVTVQNPTALSGFEAKHVTVTATRSGSELHVDAVTPLP